MSGMDAHSVSANALFTSATDLHLNSPWLDKAGMSGTGLLLERPFRAPFGIIVPILGIALCLLLMFSLPGQNWLRLFVWLVIGLVIYFFYGRKHSAVQRQARSGGAAAGD